MINLYTAEGYEWLKDTLEKNILYIVIKFINVFGKCKICGKSLQNEMNL